MNRFNRILLAIALGLGLSLLISEASLRLIELSLSGPPVLTLLAAGAVQREMLLVMLGLIGFSAGAAGGALAAVLSRCPVVALPVGAAAGLPVAFTALVGVQPMIWVFVLGVAPILGALVAAGLVDHLQRLDARSDELP